MTAPHARPRGDPTRPHTLPMLIGVMSACAALAQLTAGQPSGLRTALALAAGLGATGMVLSGLMRQTSRSRLLAVLCGATGLLASAVLGVTYL